MKQPTTIAISVCLVSVISMVAAAHIIRTQRAEDQSAIRSAEREQSQSTGMTATITQADPVPKSGDSACVMGVDTFAVTAARMHSIPERAGAARVLALREISAHAVFAERFVEWAKPAPTLPKRMGSEKNGHGTAGERTAVQPPREACQGAGVAEFPASPAE